MKPGKDGPRIGDSEFVFDSTRRGIPRRIVRTTTRGNDEVLQVFAGAEAAESAVLEVVQRLAREHPDDTIALEWQSNRGWVRYLTSQRGSES